MTIKNGDMPAMPIQLADGEVWSDESNTADGLTKREMMAMHIMSGLCAKYGAAFDSDTAQDAVRMADYLLRELERTK